MAAADARISGGAITGSASVGREDKWSDIDLAFGIKTGVDLELVLADYTEVMYERHSARHHLDVPSGPWIYRVFFLNSTLQVDIAVVPEGSFGARAPTFRLVFGSETQIPQSPGASSEKFIGWGWLNALHVRSSLERGRTWQAEYFLSGMRNQVIALACLRFNLPHAEARGVDRLPSEFKSQLERGLVRSTKESDLRHAFQALTDLLLKEIEFVDSALKARVEAPLLEMAR